MNSQAKPPSGVDRPAPASRRRGVLLVGLGAPDRPDVPSVRKLLVESFTDPSVVTWPQALSWLQRGLGRTRAGRLAPGLADLHGKIWDVRGAPLAVLMSDQAAALAAALPEGWAVYVAMRYGQPAIAQVVSQIEADGIDDLVVVPMYPQFNRATSGTILRELHRVLRHRGQHINVALRSTWYDDVGYVKAQSRTLADYAASNDLWPDDAHLAFCAHGQPASRAQGGSLYTNQVRRTVRLVADRLGWPMERASLAFLTHPAAVRSLRPAFKERLAELADAGEKKVLVCAITAPVDGVETLGEIDVECRAVFESGGGLLHLCPGLNASEPFVAALRTLVLRGPRPLTADRPAPVPLLSLKPEVELCDGEPESLMMIGVSFEGGVRSGRGPQLRFSHPEVFGEVRKTRKEVRGFLDSVRGMPGISEAFVWSTCQRIEFYGWLADRGDLASRKRAAEQIGGRLYGAEPGGLEVNTLLGIEAWHHLMRTTCGLNSALPGDTDVVAQLQTACRTAERAGTAGPRATCLVNSAVALAHDVRAETAWSRFSPSFCLAALVRVHEVDGAHMDECHHVVIGGSATSRSILSALSEHFDVPQSQMTLIYRRHHGQLKLLRSAIGHGKRLRVQSYSEAGVTRAIADADFVYFGVDSQEPVFDAKTLGSLRDFTNKPLRVIDFNTFGSIAGNELPDGLTLWAAQDLDRAVAAFADTMRSQPDFSRAVHEVEVWIENRLPSLVGS
ncbi:MAG: ferrochelatase [Gemmatimonadota bacterium]|nr:MAG: ferrochelatase [Gemmatimonadota bacterium]